MYPVGINRELLEWMQTEAKRNCLSKKGYIGGLVLDEVTIQVKGEDSVIKKVETVNKSFII